MAPVHPAVDVDVAAKLAHTLRSIAQLSPEAPAQPEAAVIAMAGVDAAGWRRVIASDWSICVGTRGDRRLLRVGFRCGRMVGWRMRSRRLGVMVRRMW
jgi:hypothetical protein